MLNDVVIHEDHRRVIIDWLRDVNVCSLKAIVMKEDQIVGKHFHKKKDEFFLLLHGKATKVVIGDKEYIDIVAPYRWEVYRGNYHTFELQKDSILLSAATESFDPTDDYSLDGDRHQP